MNYYNEFDPFAAQWLRNLITAKLIPAGEVDERSIELVQPDDLSGFSQCHFFAGIGGWSYALQLAGWPEDKPVWTGSCPCQPFSVAGKGLGAADKRHLWPEFRRLISHGKPSVVFGEQVAAKAGRDWLDGVRTDLEEVGYAVGAADLCAAGVNAPHIRQRLYWVADAEHTERGTEHQEHTETHGRNGFGRGGVNGGLGDSNLSRSQGRCEHVGEYADKRTAGAASEFGGVAYPNRVAGEPGRVANQPRESTTAPGTGPSTESGRRGLSSWSNFDLLPCLDGKTRRVEAGTFPLAHGIPARMGRLRGYGNAIVPPLAKEFITAFLECKV